MQFQRTATSANGFAVPSSSTRTFSNVGIARQQVGSPRYNTQLLISTLESQPVEDVNLYDDYSPPEQLPEPQAATASARAIKSRANKAGTNNGEPPKPASRKIKASVRETGFDSMHYYMKTMGNHELLQKNEEIILAREIQILIGWEGKRDELEAELVRCVLQSWIGSVNLGYVSLTNFQLRCRQTTNVPGVGCINRSRNDGHTAQASDPTQPPGQGGAH